MCFLPWSTGVVPALLGCLVEVLLGVPPLLLVPLFFVLEDDFLDNLGDIWKGGGGGNNAFSLPVLCRLLRPPPLFLEEASEALLDADVVLVVRDVGDDGDHSTDDCLFPFLPVNIRSKGGMEEDEAFTSSVFRRRVGLALCLRLFRLLDTSITLRCFIGDWLLLTR